MVRFMLESATLQRLEMLAGGVDKDARTIARATATEIVKAMEAFDASKRKNKRDEARFIQGPFPELLVFFKTRGWIYA